MRIDEFDFNLLLEETVISENYKREIYRGTKLYKYFNMKTEF